MNQHTLAASPSSWDNTSVTDAYKEQVTYDANGNILSYTRNGANTTGMPKAMDNLTYRYLPNTNKLEYIDDAVSLSNYSVDFDDQSAGNWKYDNIGNLISDVTAKLTKIDWTVYGKIKSITKSTVNSNINYYYDASGNRVVKDVMGSTGLVRTFYIRDAQGNTMGVYRSEGNNYYWDEQQLYGSSRTGIWNWENALPSRAPVADASNPTVTDSLLIGSRSYELSNHLGNVLAVISDKKIGVANTSTPNLVDYYKAEVLTQQDYYPFGMLMPGRKFTVGSGYRYGFNGKENDDEVKNKEGTQLDYGMRIYDTRVGRFLSVDPLTSKYPMWSPYMAFANNPIRYVDLDGREPTPAEAARMAAHVYGDKKNSILTGGWQVSSRNFGIQLQTAAGLKSLVYERVVDAKVTEYTYATAGTENWKDWKQNGKQPLGLSEQYSNAADNAKIISGELGSTELTYVGHSLGGGEAALNSLVTDGDGKGRRAITFNAAGVGDITKVVEGNWKTPFKSEGKIDAYILRTDPLNKLQNNSPIMPDVNGNRHYLWPKDMPSSYNGHSIDNIIKNFGVKNPDEYKKQ